MSAVQLTAHFVKIIVTYNTIITMIFTVLKALFVVLLTAFNLNLTFCYPDYGSVNSSSYIGAQIGSSDRSPLLQAPYAYDGVAKKNFVQPQTNFIDLKLAARITKHPWLQEKLEENKELNTTKIDRTNASPDSLSNGLYNFTIRNNNNRNSEVVDTYSGGDSSPNEPKRKSELKCEEYSRAIGRTVWALHLVGTKPDGIPVSSEHTCERLHTPLIVGGIKAQLGEFPHMAALGWPSDGKMQYLCGGSLISERWVLTAAHCTHGPSGGPSVVRLGTHILSNNTLGQVFEIEKVWRHPMYKPPAMYADIALLELKTSVTFKENIRPSCLHQKFDDAPSQAWATGWGVTELGEESSDTLMKTQLDILDTVGCAQQYKRSVAVPRGIVPSMMCAAASRRDWQSDTCQGDSGGPLQIIHPTINCLYQLVGITSFGKLCALQNVPGVYARVSHYLDWIEGIVWPETDQ